jgi:carboxymethylenebutenolidase
MEVFIAHPEGDGPFPVVIQLMDAMGMRAELRELACRTVSWGYYVLAPDFFYRTGTKGPIDPSAPDGMARIMAAFKEVTDARATSDIQDVLKLVSGEQVARQGKIGLYGFCMGGRLALVLAQALGDRVAAAAAVHAGGLAVEQPGSPHKHLSKITAEMYFGIADNDGMATPLQMTELQKHLDEQGIMYQLEFHPAALHGFMMASRAEVYNQQAAEKVWSRMQALFERRLN